MGSGTSVPLVAVPLRSGDASGTLAPRKMNQKVSHGHQDMVFVPETCQCMLCGVDIREQCESYSVATGKGHDTGSNR